MKPATWQEVARWVREGDSAKCVGGAMPPADPEGDGHHSALHYVRVQFDGEVFSGSSVCLGYFDGGEWKDAAAIKFASYGGEVTHWFVIPEFTE